MNANLFFNRLVTEIGHNEYTFLAALFLFAVIVIFLLIDDLNDWR